MIPPHLDPRAPVPVWFVKLHVRWCAWRGTFIPPPYRTEYWIGRRLWRAGKRGAADA